MRCINSGVVSSLSASSFKQAVFLLKRNIFLSSSSWPVLFVVQKIPPTRDSMVKNIRELAANTHDGSKLANIHTSCGHRISATSH